MLFDEVGPYKICIREGCTERLNYAPKTLAELDVMTMNEIAEMMGEDPVLENILKMAIDYKNICDKCGGDLTKVEPEKMLNNKVLYECEICKERFYK
jgi:hypothetical protein